MTSLKNDILTNLVRVSGGKRLPLNASFSETGIRYARAEDIKGNFLDISNSPFISEQLHNLLKHYKTAYNDVLLTVVGNSIGDVALNKLQDTINLTENCVRLHGCAPSAASYIFCFLLSKYGQLQIKRESVGTAQPKLAIERIRLFRVPSFETDFHELINSFVEKSWQKLQLAQAMYTDAEHILENSIEFSLDNNIASIDVKSFSESFMQTGRLDAEYYQPKYEQILLQLKTSETISSLCNVYDDNFEPNFNSKYNYIELSNVGKSGEILSVDEIIGNELPSRARRLIHSGQVIVSSIEGSLSSCALIGDEYDGALCSTGFYVIDSERINSETLLVLFKSAPIQALLKQRCSGTILTSISKDEFLNMPLPFINEEVQIKISNKVQESFRLRRESIELLNNAIKAVEFAIETSEGKASNWLKDKL